MGVRGHYFLDEEFKSSKLSNYYEDYPYEDPKVQMFYMMITLGFYGFHWIYERNKEFEIVSNDAPNSMRGLLVNFMFPVFWGYITFLHHYLFDGNIPYFIWIERIVWVIIIFLILKFLYDFCQFFSELTVSNELVWYYSFYPWFFALSFGAFGIYEPLLIGTFSFASIPAMQGQLNSRWREYCLYRNEAHFNATTRVSVDRQVTQ